MEDPKWTYEEIKELITEQLTEHEKWVLFRDLQPIDGFAYITSVHRDDLENLGFDVSEITDKTLIRLSDKMADDYCEQPFHSSLEIIAEDYFEIPRYIPTLPKGEIHDILKGSFREYETENITEKDIETIAMHIAQKYDVDVDHPKYDTFVDGVMEIVEEYYK